MTPIISGLSRVLNCPKVHIATTGLVTTYFAVRYVTGDLPPTQKSALWVAFIGAVAICLREIINAWTEEDVANLSAEKKVLSAESKTNDSDSPSFLSTQDSGLSTLPRTQHSELSTNHALATDSQVESIPSPLTQRTPDMPARTKLPLVLIASASIALLTATGCQTPPELVTYREGLHQVDEPLYQAHLLLMSDAINANIRTPADQQVVQQGINAAEALYQQSKATQAAGVAAPATQP